MNKSKKSRSRKTPREIISSIETYLKEKSPSTLNEISISIGSNQVTVKKWVGIMEMVQSISRIRTETTGSITIVKIKDST
jgi:hypothetical protein